MSLIVLFSLFVILITTVLYYFKHAFSYFKKRGFVFAKPEIPFGNARGVGTSIHISKVFCDIYNQYKKSSPATGFFFFTSPAILITDLDLVKNILVKDFNNFHDRGLYVNKKIDPLSGHLFAIGGTEWKNMRNKMTSTFTSGKMKMMYGTVMSIAQETVENLKESCSKSNKIDMNDIMARYTTDVIGNVAFGLDMNCTRNPDSMFYKMGRKILNPQSAQTLKLLFEISDFFMSSIKETVEYRENNGIVRNDFLSLLLELKNYGKLKDEDGEAADKLTLEELAAQAFLFSVAGFETSSTTMTFMLYELALNPDIQKRLRQEIKKVIAKHNGNITYEAIMEMKYLQMVIDETLRLYPPIEVLFRITSNDYKIPGTNLVIEKDIKVLISALAIHRDPEIYPDPDKFDPERFSVQNKAKRHPMAHIPFGAGNRSCLGLRFGYMQIKIGLINLLLNFEFSTSDRTTIPMKFLPKSQTLAPIDGMWLNVTCI